MPEGYAGEIMPLEAWEVLKDDAAAVLVDVRTDAEWEWVGVPDLSALEGKPVLAPWKIFPAMEANATFADDVAAACPDKDAPILFICRSGVRSKAAAITMTAAGYTKCFNITTGFEGDKNADGHRGHVGGWKVDGLAWTQG